MTKRLYHLDSYVTRFEGTVVEIATVQDQPALLLDVTHFYPTSGGQPFDTGTLAGLSVSDVVAAEGEIYHLLTEEPNAALVGKVVTGEIDWTRRYDHMQQHSGQHLLSQTFYELFGHETVSVHFGDNESTLDLDAPLLSDETLNEAERFANQRVYANLAIHCYFVDKADLAQVPLRRPPTVSGTIRIVEIDAFDYSACGGTHCRQTGEIGPVKLLRQVRQNRRTRISFLCGWRALVDYGQKHQLLNEAARLFDNDIGQVPILIERSQASAKESARRVGELTAKLTQYERLELTQSAEVLGGCKVIAAVYDDRDVSAIKQLAASLVESSDHVALLAIASGEKLTLIFARSQNVDKDMGALLRQTLQQFGGGGGGRPDFAQGGGAPASDANAALAYAKEQLERK